MKIELLIPGLRGGGSERVCVALANGLSQMGWSVGLTILSNRAAAYLGDVDQSVTVTVLHVENARSALFPIRKHLVKVKPDVVLSFRPELSVLLWLIRLIWKVSFRFVIRNVNSLTETRRYETSIVRRHLYYRLFQPAYKSADLVISQADAMTLELKDLYGVGHRQLKTINNPISQYFVDCPQRLNLETRGLILMSGRLVTQKGFDLGLRAFSIALRICNHSLRMRIIGDGPLVNELKKICIELGIESNVKFDGFDSDPCKAYDQSHFLLLPSRHEGFPNVAVEAMARGKPVVAFDCQSGPREIIQDQINGLLVEFGNIQKLAEAIVLAVGFNWNPHHIRQSVVKYHAVNIVAEYSASLKGEIL